MIAAGDDVHTGRKNLFGSLRRDAGTAGGIFAVGDHEIRAVLTAHPRKQLLHRPASRFAHDIPDEQNLHRSKLVRTATLASLFACTARARLESFPRDSPNKMPCQTGRSEFQ